MNPETGKQLADALANLLSLTFQSVEFYADPDDAERNEAAEAAEAALARWREEQNQ